MQDDKLVCNCTGVTVGDIREAIKKGASTFDEVQEATGVASVCGACLAQEQSVVKAIFDGE